MLTLWPIFATVFLAELEDKPSARRFCSQLASTSANLACLPHLPRRSCSPACSPS